MVGVRLLKRRERKGALLTLRRQVLCAAMFILFQLAAVGASYAATPWQPEEPKFGFQVTKGLSARMDDGVSLAADVYYPTDLSTGQRAKGTFPVLIEFTWYGKDRAAYAPKVASYFVARGYLYVIADVRGSGSSGGQAAWFGARAGRDGAQFAEWAAQLEGANGKVGLTGCSFGGIIQFFAASNASKGSPIKALAPFCADSNFYRDVTAFGGIQTQILIGVRALTAPGVEDDPTKDPWMQLILSQGAGGEAAYYDNTWESLNVTRLVPKIVELGIPVLSETGWYDMFPGGNIDAHLAAQGAFGHHDIDKPLRAGDPESGRYQAIVGPWSHGGHTHDDLQPLVLEWFDTWLKGKKTGIADTLKPLHLFVLGEDRWIDSATYPLTEQARSFQLSPGALTEGRNAGTCSGSKKCAGTLMWAPEFEGESVLKFDSPPLDAPLIIGGPGAVTIYLKSSRPEVELTATLYDVSPDGAVRKVTDGAQLGSLRALDPAASWYSSDGILIRPSHYFTKDKSNAVPVGVPVRLDIELVPTVIRIPAGHRLRLKITSQPSPDFHQYWKSVQIPNPLTPTPDELGRLNGGIYTILYGSEGSSVLNLSTATDEDLSASTTDWGPKD